MAQRGVEAVFMRGGSSKGVFFRGKDLPDDASSRDRLFLEVLGSPDPYGRQLNGMGGGISSLSKVVIIDPSSRPDIDVDYTFGQVAVDAPVVDYRTMCGNLSSAVGPFAIDSGLISAPTALTVVKILNTNTNKVIHAHVPCVNGVAAVAGDFELAGVGGSGARITLDFLDPAGSLTGGLLPTGQSVDTLQIESDGQDYPVSLVDACNPAAFVAAASVGLVGNEQIQDIESDTGLMARLDAIRRRAGVAMGMAAREDAVGLASPRIGIVSAPHGYRALDGRRYAATEMDIAIRMLSMGKVHRAVPLTGAMCLAAACLVPGTVPNDLSTLLAQQRPNNSYSDNSDCDGYRDIRIAQPSGVLVVGANCDVRHGKPKVHATRAYRTARRLMEGRVFVPGEQ